MGCRTNSNSDEGTAQLLFLLYYINLISNPCNTVAPPAAQSALPTGTLVEAASITGRILKSDGTPVVGALVIADGGPAGSSPNATDLEHYSTHSSINSDGTFTLSGLPTAAAGAIYRIAVEPVHDNFSGRIDTQLDCFLTPSTFTPGWYAGADATVTTDAASATTFTLLSTDDNTVKDLGTIKLVD